MLICKKTTMTKSFGGKKDKLKLRHQEWPHSHTENFDERLL